MNDLYEAIGTSAVIFAACIGWWILDGGLEDLVKAWKGKR